LNKEISKRQKTFSVTSTTKNSRCMKWFLRITNCRSRLFVVINICS